MARKNFPELKIHPAKNSSEGECNSRLRIERMQRLHALLQEGKFPNCRTLAEKLEVSAKTIQRDLEFMQDRRNLPIAYDPQRRGYYYTQPVANFPDMEISEGEVVALLIAQKAFAQYRGTVFEKPLRAACAKIATSLRDVMTVNLVDLNAAVSFYQPGATVADTATFATLARAVREMREVAFDYHKLRGKNAEHRRVRPYHLTNVGQQWYCIALDLERGALRNFALPRITAVTLETARFSRPLDFSIEEHLAGSFGIFRGDGKTRHDVRIHFTQFSARLVTERKWHTSQKFIHSEDGCMELQMTLRDLEEIERWILSWGGHATVLGPIELKQRVADAAQAILSNHLRDPD